MGWGDKFLKWAGVLIAVAGIGVPIYFSCRKDIPKIEVQTISERLLTSPTQVEGLEVKYTYDSLEVHNLWQMQYVIRNVGDVTIVGRGSDNMVIGDGVRCLFNVKNSSILSLAKVDDNFEAELNKFSIRFKQWRVNEFIELSVLIESEEKPILKINDRDIRDSKIIYTQFNPTDNSTIRPHLFDRIPNTLFKVLRFIYTSVLLGLIYFVIYFFDKSKFLGERIAILVFVFICIVGILSIY